MTRDIAELARLRGHGWGPTLDSEEDFTQGERGQLSRWGWG